MKLILLLLLLLNYQISNIICWSKYPLYQEYQYDYRIDEVPYPNKSPYSMNWGNPEEFRVHVHQVCRYQFSGAWNLITPDQMRFFELQRSLYDRWYYCGLPIDMKPLYREYGEAAVIFYGPGRRQSDATTQVSALSAYFSQKQSQLRSTLLTPRVLGKLKGFKLTIKYLVLTILKVNIKISKSKVFLLICFSFSSKIPYHL